MKKNNKHKAKVFPTPPLPCISSAASVSDVVLAVLKLLPVTILALSTLLSVEDQEVLAYLITRSNPNTFSALGFEDSNVKAEKKCSSKKVHNSPVFDCGCFDCYTSYWFRWDSSVNRELIHQAIEAYEESLTTNLDANTPKKKNGKKLRRERQKVDVSGELADIPADIPVVDVPECIKEEVPAEVSEEYNGKEIVAVTSGGYRDEHRKGIMGRKVLFPDVLGLFNSRLWSLWGPNI